MTLISRHFPSVPNQDTVRVSESLRSILGPHTASLAGILNHVTREACKTPAEGTPRPADSISGGRARCYVF